MNSDWHSIKYIGRHSFLIESWTQQSKCEKLFTVCLIHYIPTCFHIYSLDATNFASLHPLIIVITSWKKSRNAITTWHPWSRKEKTFLSSPLIYNLICIWLLMKLMTHIASTLDESCLLRDGWKVYDVNDIKKIPGMREKKKNYSREGSRSSTKQRFNVTWLRAISRVTFFQL